MPPLPEVWFARHVKPASSVVADDLLIATRRAEHLEQHGATVVGPSQQAGLAGIGVVWALLTCVIAWSPTTWAWGVLAIGGAVISVATWIRDRRRRALIPFLVADPEQPFGVLTRARRRDIGRQMRGRDPVTDDTAPLVRAMLGWQRRSTRIAVPVLIGLFAGLVGMAGATLRTTGGFGVALLVFAFVVAVSVTVLGVVEARRRRRVLATIDDER